MTICPCSVTFAVRDNSSLNSRYIDTNCTRSNHVDVAKAHVLALQTPAANGARIPLYGGGFTWGQAVEYLHATRPDLRARLVPVGSGNPAPSTMSTISTRGAEEKLGIKSFIGWKQSLDDTVDSLLELEKKWNASAQ